MTVRKQTGRWKIVTSRREAFYDHRRDKYPNGRYEGIFLGNDGEDWVVGRMFTGASMTDGFHEDGGWWYSSYYDSPDRDATAKREAAIKRYFERASDIGLGDGIFQQRTHEAVEQHLSRLVDVSDVHDLAAGWHETDPAPGMGRLASTYYLFPPQTAKYHLLGELRRTRTGCGADRVPAGYGVSVHDAYELVINATGPIRFTLGYYTYWLSHEGTYNDFGTTPNERARRRPHPDLNKWK
ncbi:hypothetical protein ABZ543_13335 [Streptomyces roseifaciens]